MNTIDHNDPKLNEYINELKNLNVDGSYYLMLLVGPYRKGKTRFLDNFGFELGKGIKRIDLREIVELNEELTFRNIDRMINELSEEDRIIWFTHGDRLCGAYTGYTQSKVRYATPQERYLLRSIERIEKMLILDINEPHNVDNTLERYAQTSIRFDGPNTMLRKFGWYLSQVGVHGNKITSMRPESSH